MGAFTTPFRPSDIPTGLVGYWKFNNDATDSSSSGYDLTAEGSPTYTTDTYWKDGEKSATVATASNQYFAIAHASCPNLNMTSSYTIHAKVKVTTLKNYNAIAFKWAGNVGYFAYINSTGQVCLQHDTTSVDSTATVSAGRWTDIDFVYDASDTTYETYIDGNLVKAGTLAVPTTNTSAFEVGRYTANNYAAMQIKDLSVWSAALTPLQIKSLALGVNLSKYAYRPNNVSTQPTHWYKLNEVSGNRADSVATNPLTLTDTNTVLSSGGYVEGVGADFEASATEYFAEATKSADFDFGTGDFSFSVWVKTESQTTTMGFFSKYSSGGYELDWNPTSSLKFYYDTTHYVDLAVPNGLKNGTWGHFALRRSGNTMEVFVDGVSIGTDDVTGITFNGANTGMQLGASGGAYPFDGVMADAAFWKGYALTDTEIKSLACALPIQRHGIVLYSKMNGADTANETSEIGGYTLTATGSTKPGTEAGRVGTSRTFTAGATDGCFIVGDADALDLTADFGILGWAYPSDITSVTLVDKGSGTTGYAMDISGTSKLQLYLNNGVRSVSATSVAQNAWNFFGGTFDGATTKVYLNAVQEDSDAYSTACQATATDLYIGVQDDGTTNPYEGRQDELVLLQRYPRPEEIKAVYLKGLNGKEVTSTEIREWNGFSQIIWVD